MTVQKRTVLKYFGTAKDGYAYGLGREIEIHDMFSSVEQTDIYRI
jgi:hypothetical protein